MMMQKKPKTGPEGKLIERFVHAVEHLNRLMFSGRIAELKRLDLNAHQINTLFLLGYFGPLKMSAIAGELGTSIAHTTIIVKNLVQKEYVKRGSSPNDRRLIICELTDRGREATEVFLRHARQRAMRVAEKWDEESLESVVDSLELLWQTEDEVLKSAMANSKRQTPGPGLEPG
ncbi:MAG: MarR family transcriptional regulator [Gemmatimonadetes bacterium]|nr:MarR family transcriptional regulator [Gemmatimonadota bacterium]